MFRNHLRHYAFDPQLWIHFEDEAPQWNPSNIFNLQRLPAGSWHMINTADARLFAACVMLMRSVGMCGHRAVNIAALIDRAWDWIYSHHLLPLALSHHVPYLFTPLCSFTFHLNIFIPPRSMRSPPQSLSFLLFTLTCFPPSFLWWGKANAFVYILPISKYKLLRRSRTPAVGMRVHGWFQFGLHYRAMVEGLSIWQS